MTRNRRLIGDEVSSGQHLPMRALCSRGVCRCCRVFALRFRSVLQEAAGLCERGCAPHGWARELSSSVPPVVIVAAPLGKVVLIHHSSTSLANNGMIVSNQDGVLIALS